MRLARANRSNTAPRWRSGFCVAGPAASGRLRGMEWHAAGRSTPRCQQTPGVASAAPPQDLPAATAQLVHQHRSRVCFQGGRYRGPVLEPSRECAAAVRGLETVHSGAGRGPGIPALAEWESGQWLQSLLQAPWHDDAVCRPGCGDWPSADGTLSPPPAAGISGFHERAGGRPPRPRDPRGAG